MREETIEIHGTRVNYKIAGEGRPLLILHGWGSSSDSWVEVQKNLVQVGYKVIVPDLPGFGKTEPPIEVWGTIEYAEFVSQFAEKIGMQRFVLLGHSFGGQVAIQFAVQYTQKLEKLILVTAAAVRRQTGLRGKILKYMAKIVAVLIYIFPPNLKNNIRNFGYKILRRRDYIKTYGVMRDIFKKVIHEDLSPHFSKVRIPTLIIWAEKDKMTPLEDAYIIKEAISNSSLEIIPGKGHNLHSEAPKELSEIVHMYISSHT